MTHSSGTTQDLRFSADPAELDHERVHAMLSEQTYWAVGRDRSVQDAAIEKSRNFAVFDAESGIQLAYARVVTDGVTFAWVCDVVVDEPARGRGAGRLLVEGVLRELRALGPVWVLLTSRDARGLYERVGFAPLKDAERWMELHLGSNE